MYPIEYHYRLEDSRHLSTGKYVFTYPPEFSDDPSHFKTVGFRQAELVPYNPFYLKTRFQVQNFEGTILDIPIKGPNEYPNYEEWFNNLIDVLDLQWVTQVGGTYQHEYLFGNAYVSGFKDFDENNCVIRFVFKNEEAKLEFKSFMNISTEFEYWDYRHILFDGYSFEIPYFHASFAYDSPKNIVLNPALLKADDIEEVDMEEEPVQIYKYDGSREFTVWFSDKNNYLLKYFHPYIFTFDLCLVRDQKKVMY